MIAGRESPELPRLSFFRACGFGQMNKRIEKKESVMTWT
jgi:hypothetical protein